MSYLRERRINHARKRIQRYEDFVNNTVNEVKTDGIKGNYVSKNLNLSKKKFN